MLTEIKKSVFMSALLLSFLWCRCASQGIWSVQLPGYLVWLNLGGLMTFLISLAAVESQPRLSMLSIINWRREANHFKAANLAA